MKQTSNKEKGTSTDSDSYQAKVRTINYYLAVDKLVELTQESGMSKI